MANNPNADKDVFKADFNLFPKLLPPEIWKLVSNNLMITSPNDLENLQRSSPFFRNLLADQRTAFLFRKVFPLLVSTIQKNGGSERFSILNCRKVCAQWNATIDKWIADKIQAYHQQTWDYQQWSIIMPLKSHLFLHEFSNYDAGDIKPVQKFLRHFEHTHPGNQPNGRNPIISKDLSVVIVNPANDNEGNDEAYDQFLDYISSVISKYGSHLQNFSVDSEKADFFENMSLLRQWYLYMPNLKSLEHYYRPESFIVQRNLSRYDRVDTFPQFKYLETLKLGGLEDDMLNRLICQNPQISSLHLSYWHPDNNIFRFPLPCLKKLELKFQESRVIETICSSQVQWPVECLKLELIDILNVNSDFKGCSALLNMVQKKFATTLETVDLFLSIQARKRETCRQIWEDCRMCRLSLPKLKRIKLNMSRISISLDFLLPMKTHLEEIFVEVSYGCPVFPRTTLKSGVIVPFIDFEGKMLDSNIWIVFKKLKKIEIQAYCDMYQKETRKYFREDWMLSDECA